MLSVTYFYREPRKTGVSIEGIFRLVKNCLISKVDIKEFYCDAQFSRFKNIIEAGKHASNINHITGDVNFLALGLRGSKVILTIHDLGHYDTLKKRGKLQHLIYKWFWFSLPLKYVTIVTVVSEFTKNKLIEYFQFPEDRIRLIYDPVKPVFECSPKDGLSECPRILMMGTGKHKNLIGLIEASKGKNVHLDIIGWPSEDELEKMKVYKISYCLYNKLSDEEVYTRYKACDIMFMASFYEGFGMPIIEAQSVGRPVITSNIGAMKEVAKDAAILVDPNKPEEISAAIDQLINDRVLYDRFVMLGYENIVPYKHEVIAQQYAEVYAEMAKI